MLTASYHIVRKILEMEKIQYQGKTGRKKVAGDLDLNQRPPGCELDALAKLYPKYNHSFLMSVLAPADEFVHHKRTSSQLNLSQLINRPQRQGLFVLDEDTITRYHRMGVDGSFRDFDPSQF